MVSVLIIPISFAKCDKENITQLYMGHNLKRNINDIKLINSYTHNCSDVDLLCVCIHFVQYFAIMEVPFISG